MVFVPGAVLREEIGALVDALGPQKLSVISVPRHSLPVRELQELGVARVSTGPFTQRVALTALQDAVAALVGGGTLPEGTRVPELTYAARSRTRSGTRRSGIVSAGRCGGAAGTSRSRSRSTGRSTSTVVSTPAAIAAPNLASCAAGPDDS